MPSPAILTSRKPKAYFQSLVGIALWQNGPYLGVYRSRNGYVVCAVVSANNYVCGLYKNLEEALRDYRAAVKQWMHWARENGFLDAAKRLEKHLESLRELVATI